MAHTQNDFSWFGGWFAAGACILVNQNPRQSAVRLEGSSCDRALLEKVREVVGCGTIQARPSDRLGRKQLYRWQISGPKAYALLTDLEPMLVSQRHRAKARQALEAWKQRQIDKQKR